MEFVTIDVETANADMASICQIGIAKYSDDQLIDEWVTLVNPDDFFNFINVDIHGVDESTVEGAPTFPEVAPKLKSYLQGNIVVSHTHFDRVSICRTFEKHNMEHPDTTWLDSAKVTRRTWPEFSKRGYGLKNVCEHIGYNFKHHDALEDAKASGAIMLEAIKISGLNIIEWQKSVRRPICHKNYSPTDTIKRESNNEGELFGEVVVFTGALEIPRREATDLAASIGCTVTPGVTKKTTLLVVGDQDITRLAGKDKSSKHLKAEKLISEGQKIRIIKESDFRELITHADSEAIEHA